MTPHVWVLNLDADLELAAGKSYAPTRGVLLAMKPHQDRLARTLLAPGDSVLGGGASATEQGRGLAFCPTPRAIAQLRSAGIEPEPYPSFEILRAVNDRAFCASLGQTLPGALFARSVEEAVDAVAAAPPVGRQWRAKRAFGMSGRGQRPIAVGALTASDLAFLRTSIERDGGIQIEPEVAIVRELAIHGMLNESGEVRIGRLVEQECDASGQWQSSRAIEDPRVGPRLIEEAATVAAALHVAGYFGPFGIDAFEYEAPDGSTALQPRSEINARYGMGWAASGLTASVR